MPFGWEFSKSPVSERGGTWAALVDFWLVRNSMSAVASDTQTKLPVDLVLLGKREKGKSR